jgi:uncharacterized membrane protein
MEMLATYSVALFAVVLVFIAALNLVMPALTRRDLLFGVTVAPSARSSSEGRAVIRGYRLGVASLSVLSAVGLGLLYALAPAGWWASGWLSLAGIAVALVPCLPYIPAHLAARRLAAQGGAPAAPVPESSLPAAELRPRRYSEYVPWVWEALPLGIIAATAAYLGVTYAAAPAIIPIHFDASGQPNRFAAKSIGSYFLLVWIQLALELLLTFLAVLTVRGKALPDEADQIFRRRGLRYLYAVKVLTMVLMGAIAAYIARAAITGHASAGWVLAGSLVFVVVIVALGLVVAVRSGQGGARLAGASPVDRLDDRHWIGGVIYANRDDPAIIVERRYGFGWTFNAGNPRAWLLLIAIIAVPLLIVLLTTLTAPGPR